VADSLHTVALAVDVREDHEPPEVGASFDDLAPVEVREQRAKGWDLPKGTYDATITQVAVLRRRDHGAFVLRVLLRTRRLDRHVVVWQGLAEQGMDPLNLNIAELRSLRRFAERLGLPTLLSSSQVLEGLGRLARDGVVVKAKVSITPVGPQATITRQVDVDSPGDQEPAPPASGGSGPVGSREPVEVAQLAHDTLLHGLRAARHGLARAAHGCHDLAACEGWKQLGCESISEYLASPEITLSRTDFYRLAEIWQRYVLDGQLDPARLQGAGPSKLEVPLAALGQGLVNAGQALADAETLTRADLRDRYAGMQDGDDDAPERDGQEQASRRRDRLTHDLLAAPTVDAAARALEEAMPDIDLPAADWSIAAAATIESAIEHLTAHAGPAAPAEQSLPLPASRPRLGGAKRNEQALALIRERPGITIPELAEQMGIQQNYLYRILPALAEEKKVLRSGRGWHAQEQFEVGPA